MFQRREFEEPRTKSLTAEFMNVTPFRNDDKWAAPVSRTANQQPLSLQQPDFCDSPVSEQSRLKNVIKEQSPLVITTAVSQDNKGIAAAATATGVDADGERSAAQYNDSLSLGSRDRVVIGSDRVSPFKAETVDGGDASATTTAAVSAAAGHHVHHTSSRSEQHRKPAGQPRSRSKLFMVLFTFCSSSLSVL